VEGLVEEALRSKLLLPEDMEFLSCAHSGGCSELMLDLVQE
jgi:hypothetical protein